MPTMTRLSHIRVHKRSTAETGAALIESLVAILIFAIGVLALVGLQARSIGDVSESRYRSEAAFLANRLLGQIMTDPNGTTIMQYQNSSSTSARLQPWVDEVTNRLPGASSFPPVVTLTAGVPVALPASGGAVVTPYTVNVTVRWSPPGTRPGANAAHSYTTTSVVSAN